MSANRAGSEVWNYNAGFIQSESEGHSEVNSSYRKCSQKPGTCLWSWKGGARSASGGYVVDSMRIAVGCMANAGSFEEAVIEAVNLGGDADTNGAITGGLAGAWYGYDAIPEAWIAALAPDIRKTLNRLADTAVAAREG